MGGEIDYTEHTDPELVDMFGRLVPRWAPAECAPLAQYLTDHGYIAIEGGMGPGSAAPGSAKLQELIGSPSPFECEVTFSPTAGPLGYLGVPDNGLAFIGEGTLDCDHSAKIGRNLTLPPTICLLQEGRSAEQRPKWQGFRRLTPEVSGRIRTY